MFCSSSKLPQLVFIILTSFIVTMPAFAGTFYVRPDGNDLNSGLENTPSGAFKTIQKAADVLRPGDAVEIQPGTYNEQVTITRSGTGLAQLIIFHSNGQVIIDGQNTRPYCIKLDGADYIKIEGFLTRNSTGTGILLDNNANYNIITNNTSYNHPSTGIKLQGDSNYNTISKNTLYNNNGGPGTLGNRNCGIYLYGYSDYNTIDSNTAYQNGTGIWLEGNSSYCTITNNKTYSNGYIGIIIVGGTNYNTASNNLIYSNASSGMHIGWSAQNNLIKNNTIYKNAAHGIMFDNSSPNNTIKNNIITQNGLNSNNFYGINIYDSTSSLNNFYYNNIYKNGNDGTRGYGGFAKQGPCDISLDPLFKSEDPLNPDFLKLKSLAGGDSVESPCIDTGDPNDIPSTQSGKRIDIGAYDLYSHSPIQGGLLAEYFDNQNFTNLKLTRIDPRINFDWGNYTPDASLGVDTFSIRWRGQIKIDFAQNYTFYVTTDDGSRLWIDNKLIIDKWYDQGPTEHQATINLTPGFHDIKYEYYENGGWAIAKLYWSSPSINKTVVPSDHLYYFGTLPQNQYVQGGLKGVYSKFTNIYGASSYVFTRIDPEINFDWGTNMSDFALGNDAYLVKWKGKIKINTADTYTFYTTTDDGVRLWINNRLLIDAWWDQGVTERQSPIYLTPGLYDIELGYYENGGNAVCKLYWSSSTIAKSVIPPINLYYQKDDYQEGGLYAEYFDNIDFTNPKIKRIDPKIDFDWISFAPDSYIQSDTYSIRWTGQVKADYNETYTFYANSDDGLKLWIDNQLLINTWFDHGPYEISRDIYLTQGWHDIKIEYYENAGWAAVKLAYASPSTPKTIIPQDHFRTTLSEENKILTLYSTLNNIQDVQNPLMGHSGQIIQSGTGQVTFEWAKFNKGALLSGTSDGNNDEIIQLSSADLNKKEGTIEFWFKPNWNSDDGVWHHLFCTTWNWGGCIEIFKYSNNSIYFKIVKEGVQHAIVSDTSRKWSAGEWHHLAFSYGPAGMKFYLDYNELPISWTFHGEAPYTGPMPDTFASDIYLGGDGGGYVPSDAIFDELKIYNKQLVPSDTKAPIFNITSHQDNQTVNSSPVTILGTIDDNLAIVTVDGIVPPTTVSNGTFTTSPIPLSLGPNTITVTATDQSLNSSSKSITLIFDDITPPTQPQVTDDGIYTTFTDRLHATWAPCADPESGIKEYQYAIGTTQGGQDLVNWTSAGLNTEVTHTGLNLTQGQIYYFQVAAINNANKSSIGYSDGITVDSIAPSGTIKINNDAQYTNSTSVTLTLSATDTVSGLDKMQFSNDGINYSTPEDYATSRPWDLSGGDGTKTVYAKFKDKAGNWSNPVSDTITLDITAPQINITSPLNGFISSASPITVEGTIDDNQATVTVNGITATVSNGTFTTSGINLNVGQNTITANATDLSGNTSQDSIIVTYDNTAPTTPLVTDDGAYTNSLTTLHATWSSQDLESGIAEYQYAIGTTQGGVDLVNWTSSGTATEVTRNDLTLTSGQTYFINVKARNGATPSLWSGIGSSDGIIANEPQAGLLIDITSPQDGARVNTSTITVSGTISDNTASVTVNGITATVSNYTFTALSVPLTEGTNLITAKATKDTQTATDTINVILDQDPPSINIFTPDNNSTTKSNIVYGRVSDDTQTVTVNSTPAELLSDFRFIARPTLTEGPNTITVQATDLAGNSNQASINITYDTQTPKVTITLPLDNSEINISPIKVEGTNTQDQQFILVNSSTAIIDNLNFVAEDVTLDPIKTVITASGYDANNNIFSDSIVITSPQLSHYELQKISEDTDEADPNRPQAGSNQILRVKLNKNNLPASNEEIQFNITQGNGALSYNSIFTDINGEAQVTLITDTNSDITNQVECYPSSNPLVKTTFYVDTKPAAPYSLTKITDDTTTPVPGATIDLIVKLTDQYNNLIRDETINFEITSGTGTLSSQTSTTNYYGEAKTNLTLPNIGLALTQIKASSNTIPSVTATFNITTSVPLTITVDDLFNKVKWNAQKIQDQIVEVTITSDDPYRPATSYYKTWQKGDLFKAQDLSTGEIYIRPQFTQGATSPANTQIISYDSNTNIYVVKTKAANQTEERPYTLTYIDYSKSVITKIESYYETSGFKTLFVTEMKDFIQLPEADNAWVYNKKIEKMYDAANNLVYTTTTTVTSQQVNVGLTDADFK